MLCPALVFFCSFSITVMIWEEKKFQFIQPCQLIKIPSKSKVQYGLSQVKFSSEVEYKYCEMQLNFSVEFLEAATMSLIARPSQKSGFATTTPPAKRCQRAALTRAQRTSSCTSGRASPWSSTCPTPPTSARTLVTSTRSLTSTSRSSAA